jgi:hypothetical protein
MSESAEFMSMVVAQLNERAEHHPFGKLQELRQSLKGLKRLAAQHPFRAETTFLTYAYHYGGRTEIQFNIGDEPEDQLRHGVAFSFETSQTLPNIDLLIPKVARFNEYLRVNPEFFGDMLMWHWDGPLRSPGEQCPSPIPKSLIREKVFMGRLQPKSELDFDLMVSDFDRLLDLYRFVEGSEAFPESSRAVSKFTFKSGHRESSPAPTKSISGGELDVNQRHKEIQTSLFEYLVLTHGASNVGTEVSTVSGSIDVVLRLDGYTFFEIKTAMSARACIREGLSQILEYSYWPQSTVARSLVIVGEPALDGPAAEYIQTLKTHFSLPITYKQFDMAKEKLVD